MALLTRPDRSTGAFPNADAFLKHGLGYCVLYDGQPVGFALSYATYNSGIEIDLWIHEAHRRQGLATTVSAHLITTCLDRGLEPHWDAANDESANLAEKLGYRRVEHYRMLRRLLPNEVP
jgi:GNAT superfamily N-acetyltransferase